MCEQHNARVARNRKRSDAEIINAYEQTKSVWKAGELLGMCGQSVHERLTRLGIELRSAEYTEVERAEIAATYATGILRGDGKLDALAEKLGKDKANICRNARSQGLTNQNCGTTPELSAKHGARVKEQIKRDGHPRGMLGKHHTDQAKAVIGGKSKEYHANMTEAENTARTLKIMKTRVANGTAPLGRGSWKSGWRTIGGKHHFFRSRWEANYARFLELLKTGEYIIEWSYEPETFWFEGVKRGCVSYKPDFKVVQRDGGIEYHEVKGWMDAKSKTKLRRMKKYHPEIKMVLRDAQWFKVNRSMLKMLAGAE